MRFQQLAHGTRSRNFRCLCQGTKGVLDDGRPGCASGMIHYSIGPARAHDTIYQISVLVPSYSRRIAATGGPSSLRGAAINASMNPGL